MITLYFYILALLIGSALPAAEDQESCWGFASDLNKISDGENSSIYINDNLYGGHLDGNKVIFRLDDVSARRSSLTAVQEIMELFDKSNTSLDVGIIPYEMGQDSYRIPFLKPYLQKGLISLSIHGYTHITNEFNTSYSNVNEKDLSDGLNTSLIDLENYFGKRIISFTIPYDFFDEKGFNAVRDAGFMIFSSQKMSEANPSIEPVNFFGEPDPVNGMYRLPAVISVNLWDSRNRSYIGMLPLNVFRNNIDFGLDDWGFAVVTIEPQSFIDIDGSVNETQIHILGEMINITRERGNPTTFEKLYEENLAVSKSKIS